MERINALYLTEEETKTITAFKKIFDSDTEMYHVAAVIENGEHQYGDIDILYKKERDEDLLELFEHKVEKLLDEIGTKIDCSNDNFCNHCPTEKECGMYSCAAEVILRIIEKRYKR